MCSNLLPLADACDYLKRSEMSLLLAVAEGAIRVGVLGKSWIAYAKPTGEGWRGHVDGHVIDYRNNLRPLRFTHAESARIYTVQEFFAVQFWYLHHTTAYTLIVSADGLTSQPIFLEPRDGADLHAKRPEAFPWAQFVAICGESRNPGISLAKQDLLFLRKDLDEFKPEKLGTTVRENLLRVIYHMAKDGYGWDPAASKSPFPKELAKLTGLSDDTTRRILAQAKKTSEGD
jgi:hypothetical protein